MGCADQGCDPGGERCGRAGAHGLNVGGVAEIETSIAVGGVRGQAIEGVGEAGAAGGLNPAADARVGTVRIAAAGCGEGVEGGSMIGVIGELDWAWGAGGGRAGVLAAGRVGGSSDGEDAARLGRKFYVTWVGEVDAVVTGRGDQDDVGLGGGVGDLVEGGEEAGSVAGSEVGYSADREGDDISAVGNGVFDTLHHPAE